MVRGNLKMPFFTKGNITGEFDLSRFARESHSFLLQTDYPEPHVLFDVDRYFDVLFSAYYTVSKSIDPGFPYSHTLKDLFYIVFPTPETYRESLRTGFSYLPEEIGYLQSHSMIKEDILNTLYETKAKLMANLNCIKASFNSLDQDEYILVSKQFTEKAIELFEECQNKVSLVPENIILYGFYSRNPARSWKENPLAFFIQSVYNDKSEVVKKAVVSRGTNNTAPNYHPTYRRESLVSLNRIEEKIASLAYKGKKQAYLNELSNSLNILFAQSLPEYRWVYQFIARKLAERHKSFSFALSFDYSIDRPYAVVETAEFLKKLLDPTLVLVDLEGKQLPLFENRVDKKTLSSFVGGDLDSVKEIRFGWPSESVYYFLMKMTLHGAAFSIADLESMPPKIFLPDRESGNKVPFKSNRYYTYKSEYKAGNKPNTFGAATIDALFC